MLADDEEERMRRPILTDAEEMAKKNEEGTVVQPWRTGPAKIWYDMMNLPMTSQAVNYGFKLKVKIMKICRKSAENCSKKWNFL